MVSKVDALRAGMNQNKKVCTLVYLLDNDRILLGLKKRGIGEGKWNGFGGKVHINEGETIVEGAIREVEEECGIIVQKSGLRYTGTIDFDFIGRAIFAGKSHKHNNPHSHHYTLYLYQHVGTI